MAQLLFEKQTCTLSGKLTQVAHERRTNLRIFYLQLIYPESLVIGPLYRCLVFKSYWYDGMVYYSENKYWMFCRCLSNLQWQGGNSTWQSKCSTQGFKNDLFY